MLGVEFGFSQIDFSGGVFVVEFDGLLEGGTAFFCASLAHQNDSEVVCCLGELRIAVKGRAIVPLRFMQVVGFERLISMLEFVARSRGDLKLTSADGTLG